MQVEIDRVAIENQKKMLANRQKQQDLVERIRIIAGDYAEQKHIDTHKFEFDLSTVRFREIKTPE